MARGRKPINPIVKFFNGRLGVARNRPKPQEVFITGQDCYDQLVLQDGKCALTGIELTFDKSGDKNIKIWSNASIDRIDSSIGYTRDNIHIVCTAVNLMKTDLPLTNFVKWCKYVVQHQGVLV